MQLKNRFEIICGDITKVRASAIVNAANNSLLGGGGVDGAIHKAAGRELLEECIHLNGCNTGEAKITRAYNIKTADFIIHTVGPVYGSSGNDEALLKSCYEKSLMIALENKFKTIAFPAISCGVYGYPLKEASITALKTTKDFIEKHEFPKKVLFILFSNEIAEIYKKSLNSII